MSGVGLVHKTVMILRAVSENATGIGLSELSRHAGIPKATCLRVLAVLESEQLIALDDNTKRYGIALGALAVVGPLLDPDGAYRVVQRELEELVAATQETAGLDILMGTDVSVVAQIAGPQLIGQTPKPVPRSLPTWSTSTGKVLLASLDRDQLEAVHAGALKAAARHRSSKAEFLAELEAIRANGYGVARDEMEEGAAAVAAPVWVNGAVSAAAWIGGPSFRLTRDRVDALAQDVIGCAQQIGEVLTLTGGRITGPINGFGLDLLAGYMARSHL